MKVVRGLARIGMLSVLTAVVGGCAGPYHWYGCICPPYGYCPYAPPPFGPYGCGCATPAQEAVEAEGVQVVQPLQTH